MSLKKRARKIQIKIKSTRFFVVADFPSWPFWQDFSEGKWESGTLAVLEKFLDKNHSYLDIGAWIGPLTLFAANKAKKSYALEPDPLAYKKLLKNISLNPRLKRKIVCLNAALVAKGGKIRLYYKKSAGDSMSSILDRAETINKFTEVRGITIEGLVSKYEISDLNFIKIDVEGGEYSLLPAVKLFLKNTKPTLFLSLHPNFFADSIEKKLTEGNVFLKLFYRLSLFKKLMIYIVPKISTLRLIQSLNCYKYFYNTTGQKLTWWDILFSKRFAKFNSLVASKKEW